MSFLDDLVLSDVVQQQDSTGDPFFMFQLNGFSYHLYTECDNGVYFPFGVDHAVHGSVCPVCHSCYDHYTVCYELNDLRSSLFLRLIEHPSVRLHWIFTPYRTHEEA